MKAIGSSATIVFRQAPSCIAWRPEKRVATCQSRSPSYCLGGSRSIRIAKGADLLRDAALRVLAAAENIGVRALLVHALSADAKRFYEKHDFRESHVEANTLMVTVDEAARMLR